jgi:hypothetical protein
MYELGVDFLTLKESDIDGGSVAKEGRLLIVGGAIVVI